MKHLVIGNSGFVGFHLEKFLIDKYGYIRSKWKKNETDNIHKVSDYLSTIIKLEKEGKILNFPDEHVH